VTLKGNSVASFASWSALSFPGMPQWLGHVRSRLIGFREFPVAVGDLVEFYCEILRGFGFWVDNTIRFSNSIESSWNNNKGLERRLRCPNLKVFLFFKFLICYFSR
jgi:hypothetical protein